MIQLDREFLQNPHDLYRRLREDAPATSVVMWGGVRVWLVTRYAEAKALLNDSRLSKDHTRAMSLFPAATGGPHAAQFNAHMLLMDPPDHTRLRKLVVKAFTGRVAEQQRQRISEIADELLDGVERLALDGPVDLIDAFAAPLPMRVIGEMLGVPAGYWDSFRTAVEFMLATTDPVAQHATSVTLTSLLTRLIADKRSNPGQDLLTALLEASDDGDRLSASELLATTYLLIVAGYETTVNLIANGILALLRNTFQLQALREEPSRIPSAVEEFLRFDGPVNIATTRFTTVPIQVGDVSIPADELVMIALLAANRDGAQFNDPDRLDINRKPNAHLAFGHGIHYCVGAPLARLEGEIALAKLLARFDRLTLDDGATLEYRNSTLMHGLKSLPVRLSVRRSASARLGRAAPLHR
jgi:cytochrome P450